MNPLHFFNLNQPLLSFIALIFLFRPGLAAVPVEVGTLPNGDDAASCGCFAWTGMTRFNAEKLIFQEFETQDKKTKRMKIDGRLLNFSKSEKGAPASKLELKSGATILEKLSDGDCMVKAKWTVTKINPANADDEASRSVEFKVEFAIQKGDRSRKVEAVGYCGC